MCMCVRARVCVYVRAFVCVRLYVFVCVRVEKGYHKDEIKAFFLFPLPLRCKCNHPNCDYNANAITMLPFHSDSQAEIKEAGGRGGWDNLNLNLHCFLPKKIPIS